MITESWVEGKSVEEKYAQPTERTAALWGLSSKMDSRIWVNFTRNGLRLGSRHQESPHTHVSRNSATVVIRDILPELRRRRTGLLPSVSKSSFQMRAKFCISFGNQGPRVWRKGGEAHSPSCLKSSVKFPQSVMIWGAMSSAGVGPLCFLKTNVTASIYQDILEHFMLPSAHQLFKDADFIFQQDLAPAHTAKSTKGWLNDHGVGVLDWPANSPDLNPIKNLWGIVMRENEKQETNKSRWAEGHCQRNLGFHTTSAVPQTDHLHAPPNWDSN